LKEKARKKVMQLPTGFDPAQDTCLYLIGRGTDID
jgi:hypothetical protein